MCLCDLFHMAQCDSVASHSLMNDDQLSELLRVPLPDKHQVCTPDDTKKYGLAYTHKVMGQWVFYRGSFRYIWGFYEGLLSLSGHLEASSDHYEAIALFQLDDQLQSAQLIRTLRLLPSFQDSIYHQSEHDVLALVRDITFAWGQVPPLDLPK